MNSTLQFNTTHTRIWYLSLMFWLCTFYSYGQTESTSTIYIKIDETSSASNARIRGGISISEIRSLDGVQFASNYERSIQASNTRGLQNQSKYLKGIYKLEVNENQVESIVEYLSTQSNVIYVEQPQPEELLLIPNDPDHLLQDYLSLIQAYDAWDVAKSSTDIIIGISDAGVDYNHEDMLDNHFFNEDDPVNGIDDDGNGYVDDYLGYDFADNDTDPDADLNTSGVDHGSSVAGVSSATINNSTGMAGIGYYAKYFPLKVFQSDGGSSNGTYESITYAADLGIDVINLSWGSVGTYSQFSQDVINYAVLEKDMVVVAAAGNTDAELDFYPASYDHVLSVGASNISDEKASFGTYSYNIDLMAPGASVYSIRNDDTYATNLGSSFSAPQVAGVAALVREKYPELSAIQVMERIRMTTDDIYSTGSNADYTGQLGKGRLNAYRAVSDEGVASMRMANLEYSAPFGELVFFGDTVDVNLDFANILRDLTDVNINVSCNSEYVEMLNPDIILGDLGAEDTLTGVSLKIKIADDAPSDERLVFRVESEDEEGYEDFEYFEFNTAPSYLDLDNENILLTVSSNGGLGYEAEYFNEGNGLMRESMFLSSYMGVMIGNHKDSISDNVINDYDLRTREEDLIATTEIRFYEQAEKEHYLRSTFSDDSATNVLGIHIEQEFIASSEDGEQDYLIAEYYVSNANSDEKPDLKLGFYADFNLEDASANFVGWNADEKMGYTYSAVEGGLMAGVAIISDHSGIINGIDLFDENDEPLDINDDYTFTDSLKYNYLTTEKTSAGGDSGYNVAQLLSADLGTLAGLSSEKVAFVMVFGNTEEELIENLNMAKTTYENFLSNPGLAMTVQSCRSEQIYLENEQSMILYTDALGLNQIDEGTMLSLAGFDNDSSFYFKEVVDGYESDFYRLYVDIANPQIEFRADPEILYLDDDPSNSVQFIDLSLGVATWSWDFNNGSFSTLQNPTAFFDETGTYSVELSIVTELGCADESTQSFEVLERGDAPTVEDQTICTGETAILSASDATQLRFYLEEDDEVPVFEGEEYLVGPLTESATFYISSMDGPNESLKVETVVTVDPIQSNFVVNIDTTDLTSSQMLLISDLSTGANSIQWEINGVDAGNESSFTYDYEGQSSVSITQYVTSINSCQDQQTQTQNVSEATSAQPGVVAQDVCNWSDVSINPINGDVFVFYEDESLTTIIGKGSSAIFGPITSDTSFFVTNISEYLESEAMEIEVDLISHKAQIEASPDSLAMGSAPNVSFSVEGTNNSSYAWYFNNELIEVVESPTLTLDSVGNYDIVLVTTSAEACLDTATLQYKVYEVLDLGEELIKQISTYPNPAYDHVIIESHSIDLMSNIKLFNVLGVEFDVPIITDHNQIQLDLTGVNPGTYVISGQMAGAPFHLRVERQ